MTAGDGEPAVEALTDGEDLRHRQVRGSVAYGQAIGSESLRLVVDPENQLLVADPVAVGGRPESAGEVLQPFRLGAVVRAEKRLDVGVRRTVVARS